MCGIVGMVASADVVPGIVEGLRRLEYRGYDSAGVAVLDGSGALKRVRAAGKIAKLELALEKQPIAGLCGIGHTRWATHGRPTDDNAHPHASCGGDVALVHNGIIENFLELRERLREAGHELKTDTDTEVLAHLIEQHYAPCGKGGDASTLAEAVRLAVREVVGVHAVAVVSTHEPEHLVVSTNGPPALIGVSEDAAHVASDLAPILQHARDILFLEEGELAVVGRGRVELHDAAGARIEREPRHVDWNPVQAEKGGYKHFMLKEIHEQPRVLEEALVGHVRPDAGGVTLEDSGLDDERLKEVDRVLLLGCGTSYHAALIGRHLIERLARVPCDVEIGSEFRYRDPIVSERTLAVGITQSGETADTIAAMREAKERGARVLAVTNILGSLATRVGDGLIHMRAGLEIGVASTKCFTAQIVSLTLLALRMAQARGRIDEEVSFGIVEGLRRLPRLVEEALHREPAIDEIARQLVHASGFLFLGRGVLHPAALEGALKLKEISYVHAEGYPAGEMKHGPIALIDEELPVVGLCLQGPQYDKMLANVQEVKARDGILVAVVTEGDTRVASFADHVIEVPEVQELLSPVVASIPLQLLAYHVGVRRGCDVDQPRNLAKSVTVE